MRAGAAPIPIGRLIVVRVHFGKKALHHLLFGVIVKDQVDDPEQDRDTDATEDDDFDDAVPALFTGTVLLQIGAHALPF
jgi:hypothetical protein